MRHPPSFFAIPIIVAQRDNETARQRDCKTERQREVSAEIFFVRMVAMSRCLVVSLSLVPFLPLCALFHSRVPKGIKRHKRA